MKKFLLSALTTLAVCRGAQSAPVFIDFEDIAIGPSGVETAVSFVSQGFHFAGGGTLTVAGDGLGCMPLCASNGTQVMRAPGANQVALSNKIVMTRVGGGTFQVVFANFAETFAQFAQNGPFAANQTSAVSIEISGIMGGVAQFAETFTLDGINDGAPVFLTDDDFETHFLANFSTAIDTLWFTGFGDSNFNNAFSLGGILIDAVSAQGGRTDVPAPGSLALLGLGLAFLAYPRRRGSPASVADIR